MMELKTLEVGMVAPDFTLVGSDEQLHTLSSYRGKTVILYFYPRDNTPGCTTQAQNFRDHISEFEAKNAVILGVSRDKVATHQRFCAKHDLPFILLADTDENVVTLYDVLKEKMMYGKTSIGIERSTFVINEEGIIEQIFRKVKVKTHIEDLQAALTK